MSFIALSGLTLSCSSAPPYPLSAEPAPVFTLRPVQLADAPTHSVPRVVLLLNIDLTNPSSQPITLRRLQLSTVGPAQYNVPAISQSFDVTVGPGGTTLLTFRAPANVEETISGANAPLTFRGIAVFNRGAGEFKTMFVQRVHASTHRPLRRN